MSFALAREKAAVFSDWLLHATVAAHESGHFLNAFQRKGRLAQGLHGDGHQLHRVVVRRHTVGTESAAALAAVDDGPLAAFLKSLFIMRSEKSYIFRTFSIDMLCAM